MEIRDLDKQIRSGKLSRLYFFYGEEQFMLEDKLKRIKKKLIAPEFSEFNYTVIDEKKITADRIILETQGVPVMADKKVVIVKSSGIFGNSKSSDYKRLIEELKNLPDYLCLIFTEKEFDKKKEKNLDIFREYGEIVKFDFLTEGRLELWIEQCFEDAGKTVLNKEIKTIISKCGLSMRIIGNECRKLISYTGERTKITAEDVEAVVSVTVEAQVFDMLDRIAENRVSGVMQALVNLQNSGENPSAIMTLITGRIAELLTVKQLSADGLDSGKISEYFEPKRPPFVIKKLITQSKRFDSDYLKKMMLKGVNYTASVRSGALDKWVAVEMYVSELTDAR